MQWAARFIEACYPSRMKHVRIALTCTLVVAVFVLADAQAQTVGGKWTATFDTIIGQQVYEYNFVANGSTLTGTIKGNLTGEAKVDNGKLDGKKITFTEITKFMDMPLAISYVGEMTSADEIKFTRTVEGIATEDLIAKRVK